MRVLITGAGGFLGRALVRTLADAHRVVALDGDCGGLPDTDNLICVTGDLADPEVQARAVGDGCDALIHLATIPGGASEQDPEAARRVNLDAGISLVEVAARAGTRPRLLFASSIAVLGDPLPEAVDDSTPLRPSLVYGAHKAMMEQWLATLTRRGAISGLSLRLPAIVARPPGTSGLKSAFVSEVFHAALSARAFICPVSAEATMWLMSAHRAAVNFSHALENGTQGGEPFAVTLPAVRTSMGALVEEIARQAGSDPDLVSYEPDPALEARFGRYPPLDAPAARATGFSDDGTLEALVAAAIAHVGDAG
jgi:D-erythronate 2-dehydrogenase